MNEATYIQKQWEKLWNLPQLQALLPREPRIRYYRNRGDCYAFAWTTEPCGKDKKFYACVYRIIQKGKVWKLKKRAEFARRKCAKARALKWFKKNEKR